MNISTSECSSGCESGWTTYLDQPSNSRDRSNKGSGMIVSESYRYKTANLEDNCEGEDMSMVSDASSGPPHFQEDDHQDCSSASEQENKRKKKKKIDEQRGKQHNPSHLDDTASSKKHVDRPPSGGSMENTSGFAATKYKKQFGLFQSGKPASGGAGGLQGRKWE